MGKCVDLMLTSLLTYDSRRFLSAFDNKEIERVNNTGHSLVKISKSCLCVGLRQKKESVDVFSMDTFKVFV